MLATVGCIILVILSMIAASLRPVYGVKPLKELKRRSRKGDHVAQAIYQVARHGYTADFVLLSVSIVGSAGAFTIIARGLSASMAVFLLVVLMLLIVVILPSRSSGLGRYLATRVSPYLAKGLVKVRPLTNKLAQLIRRNRSKTVHTGLYEKEDLIELLDQQKTASHNRIEQAELDLAKHALNFGDKKVADYMVPRRAVHFVKAEDPIGPILLSELHDSGFSRFPVKTDDENKIVGTLYLKDLVEKRVSGIVSNVMSPDVFYVRDDESLERVLAGFLKTKHHLFVVVNEFEEVVGVITIEDVLEQILGRKIIDEFDRYSDIRAVAKQEAHKEHLKNQQNHSIISEND